MTSRATIPLATLLLGALLVDPAAAQPVGPGAGAPAALPAPPVSPEPVMSGSQLGQAPSPAASPAPAAWPPPAAMPPPAAQPAPLPAPTAAPPRPEEAWWTTVRPAPRSGAPKAAVSIVGAVVAGLGAATLFAGSVTWLTAWAESRSLDDECPNHRCVIGTRGGDAYESTRDLDKATDVLVAVGVPAIVGGISLVILGAGMRGSSESERTAIRVAPRGAGATVEVTF